MDVDREDVRRIAELARLDLDAAEIELFTAQLRSILTHVEHLGTAAAEDAPDTERSGPAAPPRSDEPGADPLQGPPAAFAVAWLDGFFTIPRLAAMDQGDDESAA